MNNTILVNLTWNNSCSKLTQNGTFKLNAQTESIKQSFLDMCNLFYVRAKFGLHVSCRFWIDVDVKQRVCLKFSLSNGITATQSLNMLKKCFGKHPGKVVKKTY